MGSIFERMNTNLPKDLERFVQAKVRSGRFTSSDEAVTEAVRLLRQREEAEEARVLRASAKAWRTCGPGEDGPRRRCSRISAVSSTFPRTHDLPLLFGCAKPTESLRREVCQPRSGGSS